MVNNPELINKMINNINKLDDELIKEAIQEVELEDITKQKYFNNIDEAIKVYTEFRRFKNNGFIETIDPVFFFNLTDCILKRYKELEELNKGLIESNKEWLRVYSELEEKNAMQKM